MVNDPSWSKLSRMVTISPFGNGERYRLTRMQRNSGHVVVEQSMNASYNSEHILECLVVEFAVGPEFPVTTVEGKRRRGVNRRRLLAGTD